MGNVLVWIIVGGLAGWVASKIMKTDASMGVGSNIIVGIIGALIGGVVTSLIGANGFTGFNIWSFLVSLLGSVILLWIIKKVRSKR